MKCNLKLLLLLFCFLSLSTPAQVSIADKFQYRSQTLNGMTIPYRLFVPENYSPYEKYPLVLALHGSGERGSENQRHVNNYRLATVWADSINQLKYPCFVLAPQCPSNGSWFTSFPVDRYPLANEMDVVLQILDSLMNEFNIEKNRLYITGLSLGGYGTWDLIARYPDKFAAAIPMSGGGDIQSIPDLLHIPIWNFHGRLDNAVPISESTSLITEFINNDRNILYTHCNPVNCNVLADSTIQRMISEGADFIYTEYQNGGHVIWDESYDYKFLLDWVFNQYKIDNAVELLSPASTDPLNGEVNIQWNSVLQDGSVDIFFSEDAGETWSSIVKKYANTGNFNWNTNFVNDCAFGKLKIILRDKDHIIRGYSDSEYFRVNNSKEGKPYVKIQNGHFPFQTTITDKIFNLELLLGDSEPTSNILKLYYSADGINYIQIDSLALNGAELINYTLPVNLSPLQNSFTAFLKVSFADEFYTHEDQSYSFIKDTPRESISDSKLEYISKLFDVPFQLEIADPSALTNHEYLMTFDDFSESSTKFFSVYDLTDSRQVLEKETFTPNNESPIFDGLSFTTGDIFTKGDLSRSGWNQDVSKKLNFNFSKFVLNLNASYNGYAKPNDYKIIFYNTIVDTSVADTLYPATGSNIINPRPANFSIINTNTGLPVEFAYSTTGTITTTHNIWLFENINNIRKRTWRINIVDTEINRVIPFGDTLYLYTQKGLSIYDTVKVLSNLVYVKNTAAPGNFYLFQNYPNPFNPNTSISFRIPAAGIVSLDVFNSLGEKVAVLLHKELEPGEYTVLFDGSRLSSGIYLYRLETQDRSVVRKMLLLK